MAEVRGRVVDVRALPDRQSVTLWAGATLRSIDVAPEPAVQPGDVITAIEGGAPAIIHVRPAAWSEDGDALRWRKARPGPTRMELLWQRQAVTRALRDHLFAEGFLEAHVPLFVKGTCPDPHIDSFQCGGGYLTTSTEYQIKRMEVGGFDKVFTLTQNFRAWDESPFHNPEFTMLEWARVFGTLDDIERDAEAMVRRAFQAVHGEGTRFQYAGREIRIDDAPFERLTVRDALARHLGIQVDEAFSVDVMLGESARAGIDIPPSFRDDSTAVISLLLDRCQAHLGAPVPVFLREWPAFMTSSAAIRGDAPGVAERSELMIAGVELSDGFPSLRDAAVQEAMFQRQQEKRVRDGKERVELDQRYLAALRQGLPPGAGMALGVDRLVMIVTGQTDIRQVSAFIGDEL